MNIAEKRGEAKGKFSGVFLDSKSDGKKAAAAKVARKKREK